jgi:putative redox protein
MSLMNVVYKGELRTQAIHMDSHNQITTDAPKDNNGKGEAFSPTDLFCTSVASCMLTIMAMKARTLGIELQGVEVGIQKKMQASPRKVSEMILTFDWKGLDQKISPLHLEELKQAGLNCPVSLSIDHSVKKTLIW